MTPVSRNVAAAIDGTVVMTTELMVWVPEGDDSFM